MNRELQNMSEESLQNLEEIVETELLTVEDIRERMDTTEKGKIRQSIQNCKYALEHDPCLKGAICRNEMTCQIDIMKKMPWKRRGVHMTDTDMNNLALYLEKNYGLTSDRVITKASNSPKGVLDIVFCAWINESALSVDKKIELARKAIENYPNAWDVIASKLPQGTNSICSTLNTPKYRKIDEHEELYVHEVNKTYIEYLMMCVDSACTDAEKWNKIIQHIKSYDVTIQNEVFKKLILNCREMCDEEKIKIKNEMRYEIYRHRYYHDADWSISEEMLCKYESTMNEIVLSDKVYEYLYIFSPVYEFPLLHPVPFSREECKDLREKNHILREEEIKTRFKEFKEKKYSLEKLIKLAVKEEHSILGEVLAQFYCDGLFDEKLFILLMELDEEGKDVYD